MSSDIFEHLKSKGLEVIPHPESWAFSAGGLHLACISNNKTWAVADPRRDGLTAGPDDTFMV